MFFLHVLQITREHILYSSIVFVAYGENIAYPRGYLANEGWSLEVLPSRPLDLLPEVGGLVDRRDRHDLGLGWLIRGHYIAQGW